MFESEASCSTASSDLLVLVSRCKLGTKEVCLTNIRPVVITHVGGVYLYLTLIGLQTGVCPGCGCRGRCCSLKVKKRCVALILDDIANDC